MLTGGSSFAEKSAELPAPPSVPPLAGPPSFGGNPAKLRARTLEALNLGDPPRAAGIRTLTPDRLHPTLCPAHDEV